MLSLFINQGFIIIDGAQRLPQFFIHEYFDLAFEWTKQSRMKRNENCLFLLWIQNECFTNEIETLNVFIRCYVACAWSFGFGEKDVESLFSGVSELDMRETYLVERRTEVNWLLLRILCRLLTGREYRNQLSWGHNCRWEVLIWMNHFQHLI